VASKISKSHRSQPKQEQKKILCSRGHERVYVVVMKIAGSRRGFWVCECDGFASIDTTKPYSAIHPKQRATRASRKGGAYVWFEVPRSV